MKGVTEDFLLFVAGIFVLLLVLVTVFGRGIVYNMLGIFADIEPSYLQENLRTYLTVASNSPGEFTIKVKIDAKHDVVIGQNENGSTVFIDTPAQYKFSNITPITFLTNCEVLKSCTRTYGLLGDSCTGNPDCYGILSCKAGHCRNTFSCNNGRLEPGEECDPSYPGNGYCPRINCTSECMCETNYKFCNDTLDNDGDGATDKDDPACHIDFNETNDASWSETRKEGLLSGESCQADTDCYSNLKCLSKINFDKVGGILIIKKYFEDDECKIKIEKGAL